MMSTYQKAQEFGASTLLIQERWFDSIEDMTIGADSKQMCTSIDGYDEILPR